MEVLTVTKSEVIKEFFKKSVLPVAVAALLYCIFKSACTKDGVTDYVWLFILCGLPFGIPRMFAWIVPGGSLGTALPLFLLNFIIGGVIGGFVLVWRLLVAVWYIFLTIYRINAECIISPPSGGLEKCSFSEKIQFCAHLLFHVGKPMDT